MQLAITFIEGLVSFISPCVLPMLPVYITYFGGGSARRRDVMARSAASSRRSPSSSDIIGQ